MSLNRTVNTNLMALRLIEDVLNSPRSWTMRCGAVEVPVLTEISETSISLRGEFPPVAETVPLSGTVQIFKDGDLRWSRPIAGASHAGFVVEWEWETSFVMASSTES